MNNLLFSNATVYSLKMSDVEALREEMNGHPERFADLSGRFAAQKTTPPTPHIVLSPSDAKALRNFWRSDGDITPTPSRANRHRN